MTARILNCVFPCPKAPLAFCSNAWQKQTFLKRWQRIDQTTKMRHFDLCVSIIGGMAAALVSMDANASGPFVDVRSVDPTITVELRYVGRNNLLGHSLYPLGTRALARPEVASALAVAQSVLRRYQYGLKIWDAYRPAAVQAKLWQASHNSDYVANPEIGVGSLHCWVSPSTPPWSTHGIATSACQRTLTSLLPLQWSLTWVRLSKQADMRVC